MARNREDGAPREVGDVVSIIGPGMKIVGDCESDGTVRIEGTVEGAVKAAKSVVVGKDGLVVGDVSTQDAIVAGRVNGSITAESRVELQATCRIQGDIRSRRVKLDEGGHVDGQLHMGTQMKAEPAARQGIGEKSAAAAGPRG
ncbi:MAG: polymer-forming cytoskeletal protein [Gemmatimonadota bacterium]|nr:polymer-forming cytoskeletal protein [Gemmatimonadota bacterium]